jgi:hypothetical protein
MITLTLSVHNEGETVTFSRKEEMQLLKLDCSGVMLTCVNNPCKGLQSEQATRNESYTA